MLGVMRGGVVFAGQLLPQLRFPLDFDYVDVTRYGKATRGGDDPGGWLPPLRSPGAAVLVIDDILDEGHYAGGHPRHACLPPGASEVYCAVFADKELGRAKPVNADFVGVTLPDRYVFGFGMDVWARGAICRRFTRSRTVTEERREG